jgi:hypothetical protein
MPRTRALRRTLLLLGCVCIGAVLAGGSQITSIAAGHEYRQDDWPSIAASPDGSKWLAWLSFNGDRDDIGLRRYHGGTWGNLQWVPSTSSDNLMPQVAVDTMNRVWVVWSQQAAGNWDIYARRFDPARQEWAGAVRLSNDPLPDINPRIWSDGKGRAAIVWQGFRGRNSNIFLRTLEGDNWSPEIRVTHRAANDWEPAAAMGDAADGSVWVVYDSYKNGNYDVFLQQVKNGKVAGPEIAVAATPRFEARPSVAVDTAGRVWVAWESGPPNWGKDIGYVVKDMSLGAPLNSVREARIRCYEGGRWRAPVSPLVSAYPPDNSFQPQVLSDGRGSVWVVSKLRRLVGPKPPPQRLPRNTNGHHEYWATHWNGDSWSPGFPLPNSRGRASTRMQAVLPADGNPWLAWPTDSRSEKLIHRPLRGQIYAGWISQGSGAPAAMSWTEVADEPLSPPRAHPNEAADIRGIRDYTAVVDGKKMHIARGDFHRHTELSWDGGGSLDGSLLDFYRYMLDAAAMDFGASTDHQGGAWPYWWWYTQKMTDMFHVPGVYAAIFGYERSASFPNGHRNIFFAKRPESRVTPFFMRAGAAVGLPVPAGGDEPGVGVSALVENDTKLLYEEIRPRNAISIPHTSGTNQGTDWRDNDPNLEPVVEIFQGARASYEQSGAPHVIEPPGDPDFLRRDGYRPEGMVVNAWAKGYRLGIIASSDHYSTHISFDAHLLRHGIYRRLQPARDSRRHSPASYVRRHGQHHSGRRDGRTLHGRCVHAGCARAAEGEGAGHKEPGAHQRD